MRLATVFLSLALAAPALAQEPYQPLADVFDGVGCASSNEALLEAFMAAGHPMGDYLEQFVALDEAGLLGRDVASGDWTLEGYGGCA